MDASFPGVIDSTRAVAMGDVDGDGDLDLLIGHTWGSDMLLINDGAGGFSVDTSFQQLVDTSLATTPSVWGVAMGDVDGDGDLDVLIGRELKANQLLINDGAGGFSVDASFPGGVANTHAVAMGDVDGDGDLDLLIGNNNAANQLLINVAPPASRPPRRPVPRCHPHHARAGRRGWLQRGLQLSKWGR